MVGVAEILDTIGMFCRITGTEWIRDHILRVSVEDCKDLDRLDVKLRALVYDSGVVYTSGSGGRLNITLYFMVDGTDEYHIELLRTVEREYADTVPEKAIQVPITRRYGYGRVDVIGKLYVTADRDVIVTYRELAPGMYAVARIPSINKFPYTSIRRWLASKVCSVNKKVCEKYQSMI